MLQRLYAHSPWCASRSAAQKICFCLLTERCVPTYPANEDEEQPWSVLFYLSHEDALSLVVTRALEAF